MESKHTPGPWEARRDPSHFGTLSSVVGGGDKPGRLNRELMVEVGGFGSLQTQEANTLLIAAAPELLEALEPFAVFAEAVVLCTSPDKHEISIRVLGMDKRTLTAEHFHTALKAIKKAKGEQP